VCVQDLHSLNGTFLNGTSLHPERGDATAAALFGEGSPPAPVSSGDILTVGGTSLRLDVVD
jgi:pSer/pThr/pTyr-binding forkhead associated (FHA) protein